MLSVMVKEEGIFRPVRGMNAMAVGAGPAHAMYFTCIEMGREAANHAKVPTQFGEGMLLLYFTETYLLWGHFPATAASILKLFAILKLSYT